MGQKLHENHSILLCFQDKRIFAFNAEILDGRQKWWENDLCEKLPVDCKYRAGQIFGRNCSISLRFRDKCVFALSALRKIVTYSKSLISRPFCIGSLPKIFLNCFLMISRHLYNKPACQILCE